MNLTLLLKSIAYVLLGLIVLAAFLLTAYFFPLLILTLSFVWFLIVAVTGVYYTLLRNEND